MINLGAGCGLRQGEVFGISADDVDEESGILRVERQVKIVRNQMVFALPKHRKTREVPLPASVLDAIKQHKRSFPTLWVTLPWEVPTGKSVTVGLLIYTREHHQIHRHSFNHHVWKPALRESGVVNPGRADGFMGSGTSMPRCCWMQEKISGRWLSTWVMRTQLSRCARTRI
jgi:integrase